MNDGNDRIVSRDDEPYCAAHGQAIDDACRNGKARAQAQGQDEVRVFFNNASSKYFPKIQYYLPPNSAAF